MIKEFNSIISSIPGSNDPTSEEGKHFKEYWYPIIVQITEKYLGKGNTIKNSTRDQVEALDLIVSELKDTVKYKEI